MSRMPPGASLTSSSPLPGRRADSFSFSRSRVADMTSIAEKSRVVEYVKGSTKSSSAMPVARSPPATRALIIICSSQSRARFS